jgi:hypothetical protein
MTDLDPELTEYLSQFRANRQEASQICAGLSTETFNLHPASGGWSVAECLTHLNVSGRAYADRITIATERARRRGVVGHGPYRYGIFARWMIRATEPPPRKKFKSPSLFTDLGVTHEIVQVLADFDMVGEEWNKSLLAANGLHLGRVKVQSPAMPLLRFSIGALFALMASHERRHLWQAKQVAGAGDSA